MLSVCYMCCLVWFGLWRRLRSVFSAAHPDLWLCSQLGISVFPSGVVQTHTDVQNLRPAFESLLQHWFEPVNFTQIGKPEWKHVFCHFSVWPQRRWSIHNVCIFNIVLLILKIQGADVMGYSFKAPSLQLVYRRGGKRDQLIRIFF